MSKMRHARKSRRLLLVADKQLSTRATTAVQSLARGAVEWLATVPAQVLLVEAVTVRRVRIAPLCMPEGAQRRDFLLEAELEAAAIRAGDLVLSLAPAGNRSVAISVWPWGGNGPRSLLQPPPRPLVIDASSWTLGRRGAARMLALLLVAARVSGEHDPSPRDGRGTKLVEVLSRELDVGTGIPDVMLETGLQAWACLWLGLAHGDTGLIERARETFDALLHGPGGSELRVAEQVRLSADLALACLALGGTPEGSRRLSEGLSAVRLALNRSSEAKNSPVHATLAALSGRIAVRLGERHHDVTLLRDALKSLDTARHLSALPWGRTACGVADLDDERLTAETLLTLLRPEREDIQRPKVVPRLLQWPRQAGRR